MSLANGTPYTPVSVSSGIQWIDEPLNYTMRTNHIIRGLFVSQMAEQSNVWYQYFGSNHDIAPWNHQGVFYNYYFISQTDFGSFNSDNAPRITLGYYTEGNTPYQTTEKLPTKIFGGRIIQTDVSLGGQNWSLFSIPEGRYNTSLGVCNTFKFEGFTNDVIYVGMSTDGDHLTWDKLPNKSEKQAVNQNDWELYYDYKALGGRDPNDIEQEAYNNGYNNGIANNVASGQNGVWTLISNGASSVSAVLGTELMPNITLGGMFAIPLMGLVLFFLLKMVKGNG